MTKRTGCLTGLRNCLHLSVAGPILNLFEVVMSMMRTRFETLDAQMTRWMARNGVQLLRIALGVVFLWFGALKLFPGLSPAQELAGRTITILTLGIVPPNVSIPILAVWECVIGLGLISGRWMRATIFLLVAQMAGTMLPLAFFPESTFTRLPYAPTLEGQYIIKNLVLVTAALVLGATVRGGRLTSRPVDSE
jgi:uncharacterized membrane protein YphA (DoxX/SURF4 family)